MQQHKSTTLNRIDSVSNLILDICDRIWDAAELMNVGVQFLREHVPTTVRMHYAITDTGGILKRLTREFTPSPG